MFDQNTLIRFSLVLCLTTVLLTGCMTMSGIGSCGSDPLPAPEKKFGIYQVRVQHRSHDTLDTTYGLINCRFSGQKCNGKKLQNTWEQYLESGESMLLLSEQPSAKVYYPLLSCEELIGGSLSTQPENVVILKNGESEARTERQDRKYGIKVLSVAYKNLMYR